MKPANDFKKHHLVSNDLFVAKSLDWGNHIQEMNNSMKPVNDSQKRFKWFCGKIQYIPVSLLIRMYLADTMVLHISFKLGFLRHHLNSIVGFWAAIGVSAFYPTSFTFNVAV